MSRARGYDLPEGFNPVPQEKLDFYSNYLSKRGVRIEMGTDEAYRVLSERKAEGLFTRKVTDWETNQVERVIYLPEKPNASTFYEESLHALDSLKGRPGRMEINGIEIDAYEYRAKKILLNSSEKRFTYEEFINLENDLNDVLNNAY
jgi:hypothetical protein